MNIYRVIFDGRKRGAIGSFYRVEVHVWSKSIDRKAIIDALGGDYEINAVVLRENVSQGRELSALQLTRLNPYPRNSE